ncbi:hypothetical protein NXF25_009351 [Crotalus adamanteus]|uniref:Uncharacterized protein n=1 Tax=Crotalus adamanteus TaxID=8729 RepID=A0AAW1BR03_CROAD
MKGGQSAGSSSSTCHCTGTAWRGGAVRLESQMWLLKLVGIFLTNLQSSDSVVMALLESTVLSFIHF